MSQQNEGSVNRLSGYFCHGLKQWMHNNGLTSLLEVKQWFIVLAFMVWTKAMSSTFPGHTIQ